MVRNLTAQGYPEEGGGGKQQDNHTAPFRQAQRPGLSQQGRGGRGTGRFENSIRTTFQKNAVTKHLLHMLAKSYGRGGMNRYQNRFTLRTNSRAKIISMWDVRPLVFHNRGREALTLKRMNPHVWPGGPHHTSRKTGNQPRGLTELPRQIRAAGPFAGIGTNRGYLLPTGSCGRLRTAGIRYCLASRPRGRGAFRREGATGGV